MYIVQLKKGQLSNKQSTNREYFDQKFKFRLTTNIDTIATDDRILKTGKIDYLTQMVHT